MASIGLLGNFYPSLPKKPPRLSNPAYHGQSFLSDEEIIRVPPLGWIPSLYGIYP